MTDPRRRWVRQNFRLPGTPHPLKPTEATELAFVMAAEHLVDLARMGLQTAIEPDVPAWRERARVAAMVRDAALDDWNATSSDQVRALARRLTAAQLRAIEDRHHPREV